MNITTILLFVFQLTIVWSASIKHICEHIFNHRNAKPVFINGTRLDFFYWNSQLGNEKPVSLEFGNEKNILKFWIENQPLKLITHGWLASAINCTGVFAIKTAYVDTGGYNIVTVDWSNIGENVLYATPAYLTASVGSVIAKFLEHLVDITGINPLDIHLIGHSLGAHVLGACGFYFKFGKIGRITGLDPAAPGFEIFPIQRKHLNRDDAEFVDVVHTSGGSLGYFKSIGHADFFPNNGMAPQPGCHSLFGGALNHMCCSHSRSYELYVDSVYHKKSLVAVNCPSWIDYMLNKCANNTNMWMGHDVTTDAEGNFFQKTNHLSPYGSK